MNETTTTAADTVTCPRCKGTGHGNTIGSRDFACRICWGKRVITKDYDARLKKYAAERRASQAARKEAKRQAQTSNP
jgi:DnaJ-class molecular chaperone